MKGEGRERSHPPSGTTDRGFILGYQLDDTWASVFHILLTQNQIKVGLGTQSGVGTPLHPLPRPRIFPALREHDLKTTDFAHPSLLRAKETETSRFPLSWLQCRHPTQPHSIPLKVACVLGEVGLTGSSGKTGTGGGRVGLRDVWILGINSFLFLSLPIPIGP